MKGDICILDENKIFSFDTPNNLDSVESKVFGTFSPNTAS